MEINAELRIFIVDDDSCSLSLYEKHLCNIGFTNVFSFENGNACLNAVTQQPGVVFLDQKMKMPNAVDVLRKIKSFDPGIYVVFISRREEVQAAVDSLRYGAFDYIVKGKTQLSQVELVLNRINTVWELLLAAKKGFTQKRAPLYNALIC
jgi:DNA-binding NtrC family response regulator